jgi:transposase
MSDKEAQRPGIVRAALSGKITNAEGALVLGISVRQFRRLKVACKRLGVQGLIHGNRGRASARRLNEADRTQIVELINGRYAGLNDCHLTEKLRELENLEISRESVRQIRLAERIAPVRRRRAPPQHRSRRLREVREGAMVLIDASEHLWLEARGLRWNLLGAIDDALARSSPCTSASTKICMATLKCCAILITTHGLPCSLYGDRLAVFVRNDTHWSLEEQLAGEQGGHNHLAATP